jgi:Binding-protein-dependent transport system inner membrane component
MILLVNVWLGYPYMMLVCTGMLQSIPSANYESSAIDGSSPLFRLTLPLVLPPLVPILISSFAFNFNNFNLIYLLTAGGPKMGGGGIAGETDLVVNYTFNIVLPRFRERFRSGKRDRRHAFRDRWLPGLAKSEIDRAKRQNLASNENLEHSANKWSEAASQDPEEKRETKFSSARVLFFAVPTKP